MAYDAHDDHDKVTGTAPSGTQYLMHHGQQTVAVTEIGAGLRSYTVGSRAVIDGYTQSEVSTGARGQMLIPWPNRIRSGRYQWQGATRQLDLTEPAFDGAIHGLTRWASWQLVDQDDSHASFAHTLYACPGWSGILDCRIDYDLGDNGLRVRTTATNVGPDGCPYGTGAHPYLQVGTTTIDPAHARVPGSIYLPVDDVGIPTSREPVDGTHYDLRREQALGTRRIDVTYTDLARDEDGLARVHLSAIDGPSVALWADAAYPYFEIFTGDTLAAPNRRRTGLGVEPMTCAPDAFNSGDGLIILEPGQTHSATWGIDPFD